MTWPLFVLGAAFFSAARYFIIRRSLVDTPSVAIAFASRAFALVLLVPLALVLPFTVPESASFWGVTGLTAVLTAIASVLQYHAMRRWPLADTVPWLALVPLFMLVCVYVLYGEVPGRLALLGVLVLSCGVFLYARKKPEEAATGMAPAAGYGRGVLCMLGSTMILGLTTALDRIPVGESGAFNYTVIWHALSALVFLATLPLLGHSSAARARKGGKIWSQPALWLQALASGAAFLLQMQAVALSVSISAGVLLVKAVSLLQLPLAMFAGRIFLAERITPQRACGSLLMLAGAIGIILGY